MSSSDYRSSSSPPRSSSSPTPNTKGTTIRRSNRPRKEPATYDLKALSDLERVWISEDESTSAIAVTDNICSFNIPCQSQSTAPVPRVNFQKLLFERELRRGKKKRQIQTTVASSLKPWKRWKGASNDVCALAWSPDGTRFAAGATAHPDEYNRRNNLTLGDLTDGSLCELPDHWVPCPGSASSSISDDRLFTTMTAIQWAGDRLYTASYDHTIRIWDVESRHRPARVIRTLPHDSKVRVMCLSNSTPNLIATGTEKTFGLWRTSPEDCDPTYTSLPIQRNSRQKTHIDLEPTNLTWGGNAQTSHLLIGGMAEQSQDEYNVSPFGHLGMWSIRESSVELRKLSRDSQNIFDIKWHPNRPVFATASTTSPSFELPSRTRSVVQLYDIQLNDKSTIIGQFPCPAMDINELSFCPMDSVYMTASCTDGSTYIWDHRNPGKILHQLRHGMPQMPLNPDYSREVTDLGVKAALWGPTIDQFYTGGSDGFLKQWDIRRSPEDVLVANTTNIEEGIVSGAFSNDKSQLLLGDFSGAIHILSCGPYSDPEPADVELHFRPAPDPESSSVEQPGIPIAQELVSTGQLVLHPVYGPIQGPQYQGPWARWARGLEKKAPADMVQQVPLLPNIRLRQFDGPPALDRELDAEAQREVQCHFNLAHARHGRPNLGVPPQGKKRKRESNTAGSSTAELGSQRLGEPKKKRKKERKKDKKEKVKKRYRSDSGFVITNMDSSIIDLTMDSDEAADSNLKPSSSILPKGSSGASSEALQTPAPSSPTALKDEPTDSDEDYWWPDSAHVDANFGYEGV
ncbi:hypothetical protein N7462_000274 [Penicillium macrosclerotiorum]|uniref:uncharacterized protein n=1 Tax=Penicillium macrosclerotiorum TaxID=303699 RepID=UPI0025481383|nr:uncharacterized protein N7462_000274 [Penicillium macrosclerotiorum]KAJ5698269.1 hypothetical protein N7462_000274 [Penicillium macrosclerotiorum]